MYKYVEDKQFLSRMRSLCGEIMQDLCHQQEVVFRLLLNKDYLMSQYCNHLVVHFHYKKRQIVPETRIEQLLLNYHLQ